MKKRNKQNNKQPPLSLPPISKKKRWAFRLISMLLFPLVVLICLEGVLRLTGFGYSTEIATSQTINDNNLYCYNPKLGWRFFPKQIARTLAGFAFEVNKAPDTYRIFVLGGSAALGVPDENYNFGRLLEIMLEHEYPHTDFEVINSAMTAINSHAVYQIAKSCAKFEPDLMVVYLGNNEVVGPYGAGTVFAPLAPSIRIIRANAAMTSMKTGQLLKNVMYAVGSKDNVPQSWGGMEMFLAEQVRPESDALDIVYQHFEQNLKDICNVSIKAGAKVILSNIGCNLKDSPPFASQHRGQMTDPEKQMWEKHYNDGIANETAEDLEKAVACYLRAAEIDDTFADLLFRLGRCYSKLGKHAKAKDCYALAREYDTLRFRADAKINQVIRSVAEDRKPEGVYFVDAIKALEENSPHETPGNGLFYEHVHYRFEGNYILAKTTFEQVIKTLPEEIQTHKTNLPVLTLDECETRLVYTTFERYQTAHYVLHRLINKPPFTNQAYHDERVTQLKKEVDSLKRDIPSNREKILSLYQQQLSCYPEDWRLRWKLADLYYQDPATYPQAEVQLKKILAHFPYHKAYEGLVKLLVRQNRLDEAERYCRELLDMQPCLSGTYFDLGDICRRRADYDQAIRYCTKSIRLQPTESINAYRYVASVCGKKGNLKEPLKLCMKTLKNNSDTDLE